MMRCVAGVWEEGEGPFQHRGLWYPDGEKITKAHAWRLEHEEFYRADRFHDAMKHVKAWRGAVECGAHVGEWSRELAKRFQQVAAIELHPATAECLRRNLEPWPNAQAVHAGLGEYVRVARIAGSKGSIDSEVTEGGEHEVEIGPLDRLMHTWLKVEHVDYMKVHVNGYELEVLKGARETIRKHRPVMTVVVKKALEQYGATPQQIFDFMDGAGYRVASRLKPYWVFTPR